jgi:hypothetical protein
MKTSIFLTTAKLGKGTGGGNAAHHELTALTEVTDCKMALAAAPSKDYTVEVKSMNPVDHKLPENPFMWDYVANMSMKR